MDLHSCASWTFLKALNIVVYQNQNNTTWSPINNNSRICGTKWTSREDYRVTPKGLVLLFRGSEKIREHLTNMEFIFKHIRHAKDKEEVYHGESGKTNTDWGPWVSVQNNGRVETMQTVKGYGWKYLKCVRKASRHRILYSGHYASAVKVKSRSP